MYASTAWRTAWSAWGAREVMFDEWQSTRRAGTPSAFRLRLLSFHGLHRARGLVRQGGSRFLDVPVATHNGPTQRLLTARGGRLFAANALFRRRMTAGFFERAEGARRPEESHPPTGGRFAALTLTL